MHMETHIPTAQTIVARSERIGLPISRLAIASGLEASTVSRWKANGYNAKMGTIRKMATELERRERELLDYLLGMYPDLVSRQEASA